MLNSYTNKLLLITSEYSHTEPLSRTECHHISDSDKFVETETKSVIQFVTLTHEQFCAFFSVSGYLYWVLVQFLSGE